MCAINAPSPRWKILQVLKYFALIENFAVTNFFLRCRLLVGLDDDDPELLVTIDGGRIRGINLGENHRAWLGIPYAKPPIGGSDKQFGNYALS